MTGWLPWIPARAGNDRDWDPPSDGEQVLILSPSGELAAGVVLPSLYRRAHPAPESDPGKHTRLYRDGARIEYDAGAHKLKAQLPAGGTAELVADGGVSVTGNVTVAGNVAVTGRIDATEDIASDKNVEDKNGTMQEMRDTYNQHSHPPAGVTPQMD